MKSPVGPYGRRFSRSAFSARFCDGAEASASIGLTCRWRRLALTQPPLRLTSLLTWKSYSIRLGLTNGSLFLTDLRAPSQAECAPLLAKKKSFTMYTVQRFRWGNGECSYQNSEL